MKSTTAKLSGSISSTIHHSSPMHGSDIPSVPQASFIPARTMPLGGHTQKDDRWTGKRQADGSCGHSREVLTRFSGPKALQDGSDQGGPQEVHDFRC